MAGDSLDPTLERGSNIARDRAEILKERFAQLPPADRNSFYSGILILAANAGVCGLIANTLIGRALNITQARVASALPMAVLPFLSTAAVYEASISQPLMEGKLNCATCAVVRGGLIGGIMGCLYPALIAIPLNASLASRYSTAPLPSKENMLRYWMRVCKPVYKRLRFAAIMQIAVGTYLSSKHYEMYIKMLQLPEPGRNPEEIGD
ncbi:transmembrane protein 126A-like [Eublepharis macularius]|uniref:Transmembrane protein 126A-like n=1 Tax=Eublepharis macularius TaxID=481883 RepID=A0AA97J317_EUBMA|nr:transmembrane protein 126A-like [Eublepharis macularius]